MKLQLRITLFIFLSCNIFIGYCQSNTTKKYIDNYSEEAIKQMEKYKIPASITMAQGILESGNGNSRLATKANNHFGIKCHNWAGKTIYEDDDKRNECFRKYSSAMDSYEDHSLFLKNNKRYAFLFELKSNDYKAWAKGLKKAGYATNPKYPDLLIKLIETNKLYELDKDSFIVNDDFSVYMLNGNKKENNKKHKIKTHNNIKYITIKKDDTFYSLCKELNMKQWQFYKYNDINKTHKLQIGEIIYLQPKRSKGSAKNHIFSNGDSMWKISQQYGIKLKKLYKKNKLTYGTQPKLGDKVYLKKSKK